MSSVWRPAIHVRAVADNAHIAQSRLILLDATLIFFMSLTIYAYIRFKKLRYRCVSVATAHTRPLLTAPQRVHARVVDVALTHWHVHGVHVGLEGERHPNGRDGRLRRTDRPMGHPRPQEGWAYDGEFSGLPVHCYCRLCVWALGLFLETLQCACHRPYPSTIRALSLVLLHTLFASHPVRYWRQLHEPCLPGDIGWK